MAKVIALSASAIGLRRRVVALEDLEAAAARLRLGHRAQAGAALADAAVVVAVDQVGGLEGGHRIESRHERGCAAPPAAGSTRTLPSRSVRTTAAPAARSARTRRRGRDGRRCCARPTSIAASRGRRRSQQRGQPRIGAAVVGDLEDVDRPEVEPGEDVGLGVGGQQHAHAAGVGLGDDRALVGVGARVGRPARARRPQHAQRDAADAQHLAGARRRRRARRARAACAAIRAPLASRTPSRPSSTSADRQRAQHRRRAAVVVGLGVGDHEQVEPPHAGVAQPRRGSGRRAARCRRGSRCAATGSASRRPGRRRGT